MKILAFYVMLFSLNSFANDPQTVQTDGVAPIVITRMFLASKPEIVVATKDCAAMIDSTNVCQFKAYITVRGIGLYNEVNSATFEINNSQNFNLISSKANECIKKLETLRAKIAINGRGKPGRYGYLQYLNFESSRSDDGTINLKCEINNSLPMSL